MDLLIGDILGNVPVPLVFVPPSITPPWNKKVDNFVKFTFIFANIFLSRRGAIHFSIQMTWKCWRTPIVSLRTMNSQSIWSGLLLTHFHFLIVRITAQWSFMNKLVTLQFFVYILHNNLINLSTYDYKCSWVGLFFLWDCQVERLGIPHPKALSFSLLFKVWVAKDSRWLRNMFTTIGPPKLPCPHWSLTPLLKLQKRCIHSHSRLSLWRVLQ